MQADGFFEWLGSALGSALRAIVDVLQTIFGGLGGAISDFFDGLAGAMGMAPSTFNYAVLLIGVLLLVAGVKSLLRRSIVGGIIWLLLAALVLGSLVS